MPVVRLLQQACFHFLEVGFHIRFPEAEDAERDRFYDEQVTLQTLRDARILDFHRIFTPLVPGPVHLSDRGTVGRFLFEVLEEIFRSLPELPVEGSGDQRIGQRRNGRLGPGKLPGIGGGE